ncbi:MAG: NAD(P)H-hydrate dehydratase [bacterium]|nr:NAD(P)H-hydrate dehydratase [bacterium]
MYLATAEEMRRLDRAAAAEAGIGTLLLMENAGAGAARIAREMLGGSGPVVVLAGPGNNGGDGLVLARHLKCAGTEVEVFLFGRPRGVALENLRAARGAGVVVHENGQETERAVSEADLVVDALLGTGLKGPPGKTMAPLISLARGCGHPVLALDVPSGLDADTGQVPGVCVRAQVTATFGLAKPGLYLYPGAAESGLVRVVDMSLPPTVIERHPPVTRLLDREAAAAMVPRRPPWGHKGTFGHSVILGGSRGFLGAAVLAGLGALRAGAGLVTVGTPAPLDLAVSAAAPELMTLAIGEGEWPAGAGDWLATVLARRPAALALGPGMGADPRLTALVTELLARVSCPVVVDADGLNALARLEPDQLAAALGPGAVLTPHPGEMARLTGLSPEVIAADRIGVARSAAMGWRATVVLKGAGTVVALADGRAWLDPGGNPALATAGSGDVLTGIITGLLAQGLPPGEAAPLGVHLHRRSGDLAREELGEAGVIARDILARLPVARAGLEVGDEGL